MQYISPHIFIVRQNQLNCFQLHESKRRTRYIILMSNSLINYNSPYDHHHELVTSNATKKNPKNLFLNYQCYPMIGYNHN